MTDQQIDVQVPTSTVPPGRLTLDNLRDHCAAVLVAAGLVEHQAWLVADSLVDAEARGISSHGVNRTRIYAERLRAGMLAAGAEPEVVKDRPGSVQIDAHNAIGHVGASAGMKLAIARAAEVGTCAVGVANSNHCGTLAYFTRQAAAQGLVAIAMSTAPTTMVYFGGRTRAVGTNPLSMAVPRPDGPPIVVDMATSAVARGKISLAHQLGQEIPEGWAVDKDGVPTTDAATALAGSVVPFSGPKGSGLAMMIDLLAGAMVAGAWGDGIGNMYEDWTRAQRVGHLFIVLDPDAWSGREGFMAQVGDFARHLHDLPPAGGFDEVLLPGEVEERSYRKARDEGVALPLEIVTDLDDIAREVGIEGRLSNLLSR